MITAQDNFQAILDRCRALGLRLSPQRLAILELLCRCEDHLSASAIYHQLTQEGQRIGYSSVYQNLEALASRALIEVIDDGHSHRYGWRPDPHHHFHCSRCGAIQDVDLPELQLLQHRIEGRVEHYRLDLYGVCSHCEKSNESTA